MSLNTKITKKNTQSLKKLSKLQCLILRDYKVNTRCFHEINADVLMYINSYSLLKPELIFKTNESFEWMNTVRAKNYYLISLYNSYLSSFIYEEFSFGVIYRCKNLFYFKNICTIVSILETRYNIDTYFYDIENSYRYKDATKPVAILDYINLTITVYFKKEKMYDIRIPIFFIISMEYFINIFENIENTVNNFECKICTKRCIRNQDNIIHCPKCFNYIDNMCFKKTRNNLCPFCRFDNIQYIRVDIMYYYDILMNYYDPVISSQDIAGKNLNDMFALNSSLPDDDTMNKTVKSVTDDIQKKIVVLNV
ncbi:hypothetical protein [Heterosigma akashiwo virus 01]|uniref:Uncharacterized protein n=1 Tax=Heterosigma akashiwo virus 01 TaxID=97195 RepID=A0A1C9C5F6_HAV01|nr:hypothetical protein D1R72_gp190 [Heterosigma akashiwo virus 01]AOM63521.1 hypothetical protein [Heterosigma akashiwo virus 01]